MFIIGNYTDLLADMVAAEERRLKEREAAKKALEAKGDKAKAT